MNKKTAVTGAAVATAVAALFSCAEMNKNAASPSGATDGSVKCFGINACKGKGECSTADHSCGKHTPCRGKGWLTIASARECSKKGGRVL